VEVKHLLVSLRLLFAIRRARTGSLLVTGKPEVNLPIADHPGVIASWFETELPSSDAFQGDDQHLL